MITYRELAASDYPDLGRYYAETFNTPPWDETWTAYDAEARLRQLMDCYKPYGLLALLDGELAGMIIGGEEQDSTGRLFNIKEFLSATIYAITASAASSSPSWRTACGRGGLTSCSSSPWRTRIPSAFTPPGR